MCGRYVLATPAEKLAEEFHVDAIKADDLPKYNVAPTDPSVRRCHFPRLLRQLGTFKWGLVPSWSKGATGGARMINARAGAWPQTGVPEPVAEAAVRHPRPTGSMSGNASAILVREEAAQTAVLHTAGRREVDGVRRVVEDVWKPRDVADAEWLRSATIITGEPNRLVARLHNRMPVILPGAWDEWLDPGNTDIAALEELLLPLPADETVAYPVEPLVNSVQNDGPELIEPLEGRGASC